MAIIGSFKKSPSQEFIGEIFTLSFQAANVRIIPETKDVSDNAPSHRLFVGRADIGAAWSRLTSDQKPYLALKLDDPSFIAPLYANLFEDKGHDTYSLIWSRTPKKRSD
jgi:uncharacterized protein (DUF736 family)